MSVPVFVRPVSSIFTVAALVAAGLVALAGSAPAPAATTTCSTTHWGGDHGWTGLSINGDAAVVGNTPDAVLRVTPDAYGQAGSAFTTNVVSLADQSSFSSHFTFRFTTNSGGADGLVFAVQTVSDTFGGAGGGIGYAGLDHSVGIELDDWYNGENYDPSASHIGLDFNGSVGSPVFHDLAADSPPIDLDDGQIRNLWVDYDGSTKIIEVRFSDSGTRPTDALLSYQEDLSQVLGSTDAYVGFTSGTGAEYADHDVLAWDFSNCYAPNGVTDTTPPSVNAGSDGSGTEGSAVSLDGTVSDADVGQTVTSTWSYSWDPSSPAATKASATCAFGSAHAVDTTITCTDNGTVIATLSATDGTNTTSDTASITIANAPPTVTITSPDSIASSTIYDIGQSLPLSLTRGDPGTNDTATCTVDWGDGTVVGPSLAACTAAHAYAAQGAYTLSVSVTDDDGDTGQDTATVNVGPTVATTVNAGADQEGDEGGEIPLDGTVTPAEASTWTYAWDLSSPAATKATGTCQFDTATAVDTTIKCTDNGIVTATLTAGTGSGAVSDTTTVTIDNVAPTVTITAPDDASNGTSYDVGAAVPLSVTDLEPGANDTATCTVDWGDGSGVGPCVSSHTYTAEDVYTITVTVTDDDGGVGTDSVDVDVEAPDTAGNTKAKVNGGGWLLTAGKNTFALEAVMDKKGRQHGHLELHTYDHHRFHGKTVTGLVVTATTASWSGTGDWDHQHGYTYAIQVVDGGEGKLRTADHIELSIYDPNGALVFMLTGSLMGGNIKIHSKA